MESTIYKSFFFFQLHIQKLDITYHIDKKKHKEALSGLVEVKLVLDECTFAYHLLLFLQTQF